MLHIYKNIVILIATVIFIGGRHLLVVLITFLIACIYYGLYAGVRKAQSMIVSHYYDYKYEFVKVFNESIEGAGVIRIYGVGKEVLRKAQRKYTALAGYKLAASYITLGQGLLCDLASTCVTAIALEYGTGMRIGHQSQTAVVATSILLLLNLSEVLKAIV